MKPLRAHQQDAQIPPEPPVESADARTVLARKGSLRRASARPCALRAVPAGPSCDGRLRRDQPALHPLPQVSTMS